MGISWKRTLRLSTCAVLLVGVALSAAGCVDSKSDADCVFTPVSGLGEPGDSKAVTIQITNGTWPSYPLGEGSEWLADDTVPPWAPTDGTVVGTATRDERSDLSVDFGQGREVRFPRQGCS